MDNIIGCFLQSKLNFSIHLLNLSFSYLICDNCTSELSQGLAHAEVWIAGCGLLNSLEEGQDDLGERLVPDCLGQETAGRVVDGAGQRAGGPGQQTDRQTDRQTESGRERWRERVSWRE